jgi:hypothetical protein
MKSNYVEIYEHGLGVGAVGDVRMEILRHEQKYFAEIAGLLSRIEPENSMCHVPGRKAKQHAVALKLC